MKEKLIIFICLSIIVFSGLHAETIQQQTPIASKGKVVIVDKSTGRGVLILPGQFIVASKGDTDIVADSSKFKVRVKISTHEVQIGKPSDKRPEVIQSSCTYSRYPCSVVDYIDISINGKPIIVPRSVFCDLADLNTAAIKIGQKESVLTLIGGDASEGYIVKIEFDATHVKRKSEYWSEYSEDEPSQETVYHLLIID